MTWKLPLDRLRVNAALTTLTEQFDAEAARDVIVAFQGLPADTKNRSEFWFSHNQSTQQRGYTSECGSVTVEDAETSVQHQGGPRDPTRVGAFKVHRIHGRCIDVIAFCSYWAADATTSTEPAQEWHLQYRQDNWEPVALFRYDWVSTDDVPLRNRIEGIWFGICNGRLPSTRFFNAVRTVLFLADDYVIP